jgi:hypothetical protein
MRRRLESLSGTVLALAAVCITVPTATHAAWPNNPYEQVPVSVVQGMQIFPEVAPDGAGGMFIVWGDLRNPDPDSYMSRVTSEGAIAPGWPANGFGVASTSRPEYPVEVLSDGAGGAYVAWSDSGANLRDIRLQRVDGDGSIHAGWPAGGVSLTTNIGDESEPKLALDGAGGVYVAWINELIPTTTVQIRISRLNGDGTAAPGFGLGGVPVRSLTSGAEDMSIVSNGSGDVYVAWMDHRDDPTTSNDIYAQRVTSSGTRAWATNGVPISDLPGPQHSIQIAADDMGRMIATWADGRSGGVDIYAQVIDGAGNRVLAADLPVCTASGQQWDPQLLWDGTNGAYICWRDERNINNDVYIQHIRLNGFIMWAADGIGVATGTSDQTNPRMALDGLGGVMVVWPDDRNNTPYLYDTYGQRYDHAGTRKWASNGIPVQRGDSFGIGECVDDGRGGLLYAVYARGSFNLDIFAQRVDRTGFIGDPATPAPVVTDVPNDQGGWVRVAWDASTHDAGPDYTIDEYVVWRSVPAFQALAAIESGEAAVAGTRDARASVAPAGVHSVASPTRIFRTTVSGGQTTYWELAGSQIAQALAGYSLVVPTTADSIGGSNPYTQFMIESIYEDRGIFHWWFSAADSGYSVDNLAPPAPAPLAVVYQGATKTLHFGYSAAPDRRGYRVYRGAIPGFVPGGGSFVAEVTDTNHVDVTVNDYYYKVTAVDVHGNESAPATAPGTGNVDVVPAASGNLSFAAPSPNPSSGVILLRWSQPVEAPIHLRVFDAGGRLIGDLATGMHGAGEHTVRWNARDDAGRPMPPGLYFARLDAQGRTFTQRIARVR